MNAGEHRSGRRRLLRSLALAAVACCAQPARAIDNPQAPDRVGAFEARAAPYEEKLAATDGGPAAARAGRAYADFLDGELNQAYRGLLARLSGLPRSRLVASQRQWLRWSAAEQQFIDQQWVPARSGSSASLSAAQYRNAITRQRVVQLLQYSAEYP